MGFPVLLANLDGRDQLDRMDLPAQGANGVNLAVLVVQGTPDLLVLPDSPEILEAPEPKATKVRQACRVILEIVEPKGFRVFRVNVESLENQVTSENGALRVVLDPWVLQETKGRGD